MNQTRLSTYQWLAIAITITLIIAVAIVSFILSFTNIALVAQPYYGDLAPLLPLVIDLGLIVYIISRFTATFTEDSTTRNWALVATVIAVGASFIFNQASTVELFVNQGIETAQNTYSVAESFFVHLMPPLTLILATEIGILMIKGAYNYQGILVAIHQRWQDVEVEAETLINDARVEVARLLQDETKVLATIGQRQTYLAELDTQVEETEKFLAEETWKTKLNQLTEDELKILPIINQPQRYIADKTGFSVGKVNSIKAKLIDEKYVKNNDSGTKLVLNNNGVTHERETGRT